MHKRISLTNAKLEAWMKTGLFLKLVYTKQGHQYSLQDNQSKTTSALDD